MKNILFILFVLLIGCSSSTDNNDTLGNVDSTHYTLANSYLSGTWDVHFEDSLKSYDSVITIKTTSSSIEWQGKLFQCDYGTQSAEWYYKTPTVFYTYSIWFWGTDKDEFDGIFIMEFPRAKLDALKMTGKRR